MSKCGFSTLNLSWASSPIPNADPPPRMHSYQKHQLVPGTLLASTLLPVPQHRHRAPLHPRMASCLLSSAIDPGWAPMARPEPRQGSVELESLVATLRSQRVFFPHLDCLTWRHPSMCPCARFSSADERHPRHPSHNPCFMMSALLMHRRRAFPAASNSAITASEFTSDNPCWAIPSQVSPTQHSGK